MKTKNWFWNPKNYILDENTFLQLDNYIEISNPINFKSEDKFLTIIDNFCIIRKGYKWDGTSLINDGPEDPCKPGYPISWKASLFHDAFYQYLLDIPNFPLKRLDFDNIFYKLLKECNFKYSKLYFFAIRIFGGVYHFLANIY